jgi:hypothetical protein
MVSMANQEMLMKIRTFSALLLSALLTACAPSVPSIRENGYEMACSSDPGGDIPSPETWFLHGGMKIYDRVPVPVDAFRD